MNTVLGIVILCLFLMTLVIFLLLFGPNFPDGSVMHRIYVEVTEKLWSHYLVPILSRILPERFIRFLESSGSYLMNGRHPLLQICYFIILSGGVGCFFSSSYSHLPNDAVDSFQTYIVIPMSVFFCYLTFWLASVVDPGTITSENLDSALEMFEYDGVLFHPDTECRTCKFVKPARSKHCNICGVCIAKHDHHCAWINGCVGLRNHKYFLAFLWSNTWVCLYGFLVMLTIYLDLAYNVYKFQKYGYVLEPGTGARIPLTTLQIFQIFLTREPVNGALLLFLGIISGVVLLFSSFSSYYILVRGMTSNESFKIQNVYNFFKNLREEAREKGTENAPISISYERGGQVYVVSRAEEIPFIYQKGLWNNIISVMFPPRLRETKEKRR